MGDKAANRGKLFHRIKYRNSIVPLSECLDNRFCMNIRKRRRVIEYMDKMVRKRKTQRRTIKVAPLHHFLSVEDDNDIREFCRNCPSTGMSRSLEKEIVKKINARGLEKHYALLLKDMLAEARDEFLKITHKSGIAMKLKFAGSEASEIAPCKRLGRTKNYPIFLEKRKELETKFLLHRPLIRRMLAECVTNLPYELFNLDQFLKSAMHVDEFQGQVLDCVNDAVQSLQEFYGRIVVLAEQEQETTDGAGNYLRACSGLLSVNISRTIAHTLLHVVTFTASKDHVPYLKLNITFNERLILRPSADEIIHIYNTSLAKIINSAKQFYVFERHDYKGFDRKNLHLCLTDDFFDSVLDKISRNIHQKYQPLLNYIDHLRQQFQEINRKSDNGEHVDDQIFDEGCQRISFLKTYLPKVNFIPDNAYFGIGQLVLTDFREGLKENLLATIGNIFNNLCAQHEWENNDICEAFDIINIRAIQKPITTEEVIETGKYMARVKSDYLNELRERVLNSLAYLSKLIQLGEINENHLKLNARAINWLDEILPVLEENTATYEQLKFEAEEKLQRVIEDINVDIKDVYPLLDILDAMDDIENVRNYLNDITLHMVKIREIESRIDWINREEISLSFPKSSYAEFEELKNYVYPFYHLLKLCLNVKRNLSVWLDGMFDLINYSQTKIAVENYLKELLNTQKVYRSKLRQAQDENLSLRFKGTVDDPDMLNWPAPLKLCSKAIKLIQDFEPSLTVIKIMCNEALMKRHWKEMSKIAGFDITPNAGTTLRKIIQINLSPDMDNYELISIAATNEKKLLENLNQMREEWRSVAFQTKEHNGIQIVFDFENIQIIVDDHLIKTTNMFNTIYVKPYHHKVKRFYDTLLKIQNIIKRCVKIQREIIRNYNLFTCERIISELPNETSIFKEVLNSFKSYIDEITRNPNVQEIATSRDFLEALTRFGRLFEIINKGVEDYFERIRLYFPRFYFISNTELRAILSLTKTPIEISRYLDKIFKFDTLIFDDDLQISSLSDRCDVLELIEMISTKRFMGRVEMWLRELEIEMKRTIHLKIKEALESFDSSLASIKKSPFQALMVVSKILFTAEIETAQISNKNIDAITKFIENLIKFLSLEKIDRASRVKIQAMILLSANNRNILEDLISVESDRDFKLMAQLRYFNIGDIELRILDSSVKYDCEYFGSFAPIVVTPSTQRCYHALIVAYKYHIYSICQGSTATGKSATFRGLSNDLGVYSKFFNCSQSLNLQVILNFFKGIAASGAWLCLEEFENMHLETVSVITQELSKISSNQFKCFVCFNIKTKITEFPESFKNLVRAVAIIEPDVEIIAEISLFSIGFRNSKELAKKIVTVYKVSADLFGKKDFSLRAIKDILRQLKTIDAIDETRVIEVIRFINTSKLSKQNMRIFEEVLQQVFNINIFESRISSNEEFRKRSIELNLELSQEFLDKVNVLDEMIGIKTGVIICGKAMTGKSTLLKILGNDSHRKEFINPKAMNLNELFGGFINEETVEWNDGVITRSLRESNEAWIVLDGPIDPWADNLNSVLDGDMKICLTSGEMLNVERKKLIFECNHLKDASPALVSRCGIVHLENNFLGPDCLINSWLARSNLEWLKGLEDLVKILFFWIAPACLDFLKNERSKLCAASLLKTSLDLFEMLMSDAYTSIVKKEEETKNFPSWIQASLILTCAWSFSSVINRDSVFKFDELLKQFWKTPPKTVEKLEIGLPQDGLIVDHVYIYKAKGNWKYWPDTLKNEKIEDFERYTDFLIPTTETVKYSWLINMFIAHCKPFLLMGPRCSGKTCYIQEILINKINKSKFELSLINFTNKVYASSTKKLLISKLFKKKSGHYGPTEGKSSIFFIDDLHESSEDEFGVHSSLELLREFFDYSHWYDGNNREVYIDDVNIVAALDSNCSEGVCDRLLRHFHVFSINSLPEESILRIYSNILVTKYKKIGFPGDILGTINQIVEATFNFYSEIVAFLKPTPNWNFYRFNLRQITKIIQVFVLIKKESFDSNKKLFPKLWIHEINRIFGDRLENSHKTWFKNQIKSTIEEDFKEDFHQLFDNSESLVMFGTISDINSGRFDEIDLEKLRVAAINSLKDYNENNANKFDLVLSDFALEHLSRICRILSLPNRNLLQVGVCGSGRQTLVKLAALIYNQTFFRLEMIQNYGSINWRDDIKSILKEAGAFGKPCAFFLRDEQIIHEIILEDVEYLLKCGEIPCLYSLTEKQEILELVRESMQGGNANIEVSFDAIFLHHRKRCRDNLHVFLAFSAENKNFRKLLNTHHSIIDYCEIDYYQEWPAECLEKIATSSIESLEIPEDTKQDLSGCFSDIHTDVREFSNKVCIRQTPGSYLELVRVYAELMVKKQQRISSVKKKYVGALEKLSYAAVQISEMQTSLANYQPQLEAMTIKAIEMAKQIEKETIEVEIASNLVKKDEKIANEQAAAAQILKLDCEADLAQAIPILEDAISALNTLKPTDITLVKSMKNPPDAIKLVMAAVCVIKDVKPDRIPDPSTGRKTLDYWGPSKRILGDMNFLQSLKDFDKDNIKPDIMVKIRRDYLPHKDFKPHTVAKASSAAEGLCKWIIAMDMYDKVAKEVAPKKEKLEKAEREYGNTMQILNEKKEQVKKIEQKLADLNALLSEATRKQQILQRNVDSCKNKLNRAQKLIAGLSEEKDRWTFAVDQLLNQYNNLPGDLLISSATIAYFGPFAHSFRKEIIKRCFHFVRKRAIPVDDSCDFLKTFETDLDYDEWHLNYLPYDRFFVENGIIAKYSKRWCLYIDPQRRASQWIQNMEKYNSIKVTNFQCNNHLNTIKDSITFGRPLILEGFEEPIDITFINLFTKNTFLRDETEFINIAGEVVPYNKNFFLYITCNLKNPQFSPEIYSRLTVINFCMTKSSLEDLLLTYVVEIEKPSMKKIRKLLKKERRSGKEALFEIEEKILYTLSESTTDILEDEGALQMLDDAKVLSRQIQKKQEELTDKQQFLDNTRRDYICVAKHTTVLYFCVFELSKINHMYQFSLEFFIDVYTQSIQIANRFRELDKRLESLKQTITYELYKKVSRSIFERDKLHFSFMLCMSLEISNERIARDEFNYLFKSPKLEMRSLDYKPQWLPSDIWNKIHILENLERYRNFTSHLSEFEKIYNSARPESEDFPKCFDRNIDRLLLINLLRPDRFLAMAVKFIVEGIGVKFVNPPVFDISVSFYESNTLAPLLFILKPESDPVKSLLDFAKKKYFENKLTFVSPKTGDQEMLEGLISKGQRDGLWICFQNCHFIASWLSYLSIKLDEMDYNNTHENFRLWLTTKESPHFPISLLEKSTKITKEPSREFKKKMLEIFLQEPVGSDEFFSKCPGKSEIFSRLIFSLSVFHCTLQERQKFGVFGWNAPYEFKEADFILAINQAESVVNCNSQPIPELYYLTGHCNYGAGANDKLDRRLVLTMLFDYLNTGIVNNRSYLFNGKFGFPIKTDHQDYLNHIERFPEIQSPDICGLHENFDVLKSRFEYEIFRETFGENLQRDPIVLTIENLKDLVSDIPENFDLSIVLDCGDLIESVISREKMLYNKLFHRIRSDLRKLKMFIDGECALTNNLEELYHIVALHETPKSWRNSGLSAENLADFLQDLKRRSDFFRSYPEKSSRHVSLAAFFDPKSFLVAHKLIYSKTKLVYFEHVYFEVVSGYDNEISREFQIVIDDLYLIGASWDFVNDCLNERLESRSVFTCLHSVTLKLCDKEEKNFYECPLYKHVGIGTLGDDSSNTILNVAMKTKRSVEYWIKRGVCLALNINFIY